MSRSEDREAKTPTRRGVLGAGVACAGLAALEPLRALMLPRAPAARGDQLPAVKVYDVMDYGAAGDGKTLDSAAFQRAINAAAAHGGRRVQVLARGGHKYLIGTIELKGAIDFCLADDAQLVISTKREDYLGGLAGSSLPETMANAAGGVIVANGAQGLTISGTGSIDGRAKEFMTGYDEVGGIWKPGPFRPKMFVLAGCKDLEVRDITFGAAPNWGLHLLGCERVLVDNVKVRNLLDVPNCDGIDPDHSRNVEIRNCNIVCGDDAVVVKSSRQKVDYGECAHVHVHNCVIETQDAGLKIGTETTTDVHDVRFEQCQIKTSSRGLCIQLRDEANVYNVDFRDITFTSRFYGDPWWGRGEAISFTAIPRMAATKMGTLHHVNVQNVQGHAENSVRICGSDTSRVHNVTLSRVSVTLDRTTQFKGALYDNRPTTAIPGIEPHDTPGFSIEHADNITLRDCKAAWGLHAPDSFTYAVEAKDTTNLKVEGLQGGPAHTSLGKAVSIT